MSLDPLTATQTPEQHAADLERERIEAANLEHDTDPGDPPAAPAFDQAVANELF